MALSSTVRSLGYEKHQRCAIDLLESRQFLTASYFVAALNSQGATFDALRDRLYIGSETKILRFDLATKKPLSPWNYPSGYDLDGGDITKDGKWLYVADETITPGGAIGYGTGTIHKIDLETGKVVKDLTYDIDYDDAPRQVLITADNLVMVGHWGQWGQIHTFDLATDKFIPGGFWADGASIYRGKDRSLVVYSDGLSPPSSSAYDTKTHDWLDGEWMGGLGAVAISPDGTEIAAGDGYYDRSLHRIRTRATFAYPISYDPDGSLLYTYEPGDGDWQNPLPGNVVARDRLTDQVKFSFQVDTDVFGWALAEPAVTDDGHWLIMQTQLGERIYDLTPYKPAAKGSIAGTVFNDVDANGVRGTAAAEPGVANVKVFLDKNNNGKLDSGETNVTTDASGNYKLAGLATGATYTVRQLTPSGFGVKSPAANLYTVTMTTAAAVIGKSFADSKLGSIAGIVFKDTNKNFLRDANERGLSSWTIYIDTNNNGKLDVGETRTLSDANGSWRFADLFAGKYIIRAVPMSGLSVVTPTGTGVHVTLAAGQNTAGKIAGAR